MRVGIIGFGFSGLAVVASLVREATAALEVYIIDETADGRGVAYATENPDHLLNVRAGNMSAFDDDKNHLIHWLASDAGKYAAATRGLRTDYAATDFIPRALYGDYLTAIWRECQEIAAHTRCSIKLVPSQAVAIQGGDVPAILTARGDAIAVDRMVLAVGHEVKPIFPQLAAGRVIQNPWAAGALTNAPQWRAPVLLIGSGLTAVDVLLSLRRAGYAGEVVAASTNGQLPRAHTAPTAPIALAIEDILAQPNPSGWLRVVRNKLAQTGDWRAVVDALRPHTTLLWQRLTTAQKRKFLARLNTFWSVHRHRCAPEIAARMDAERAAKTLTVLRSKAITPTDTGVTIRTDRGEQIVSPAIIINCTGFELDLAKSSNPLLRQLSANQLVEAHETRLGIAADPQYCAWGTLYPKLYVIGSLLTGQLLESTAVPELRVQARAVARGICKIHAGI